MRCVAQFLLYCLLAWPAAAQRGGGHGGGGMHGGGGHGGFHGGSGGFRGGGSRGARGYGGFSGHRGFRNGYFRNRFFYGAGFGVWPYFWGWDYPYWDSGYYGDYSYSQPTSNYGYGSGYSSSPPIVIYQSLSAPPEVAHPEMHDYRKPEPSLSQNNNEPPLYLIAVKGQENIRAAQAYWIDDGTLHYVNLQHEQKQIRLDSVDRALTLRLNRERHVDFRLPPAD